MPLLRDLISMPERVHQGDFVLHLTKGVAEPEQTLRGGPVEPTIDNLPDELDLKEQALPNAADTSLTLAWAGWNPLQQTTALAARGCVGAAGPAPVDRDVSVRTRGRMKKLRTPQVSTKKLGPCKRKPGCR